MSTPGDPAAGRGEPVPVTLVLGSASPARAQVLTRARLPFRVAVSTVDEEAVGARSPEATPAELAGLLAAAKGENVAARLAAEDEAGRGGTVVIGCDSVFELDGHAHGKPYEPEVALARWRRQAGRTGTLHTGQWVGLLDSSGRLRGSSETVVSAVVRFAEADEATLAAYVATGEPLHCAGAFTIDGAGAALVDGVEGDPNAVIGLSVSTLRAQCAELGVGLARLWDSSNAAC